MQLGEIFDYRDDGASELGRKRDGFDVAVVLEAVADDETRGLILGHRHDGQQLRLGADFEPEAKLLAVAIHLLDHEPLLVHLDRVNGCVTVLVVVLADRLLKGGVQMFQAMREDVGQAHHDRRRQITRA